MLINGSLLPSAWAGLASTASAPGPLAAKAHRVNLGLQLRVGSLAEPGTGNSGLLFKGRMNGGICKWPPCLPGCRGGPAAGCQACLPHSILGLSHERVCAPAAGSCGQVRLGLFSPENKNLFQTGAKRGPSRPRECCWRLFMLTY